MKRLRLIFESGMALLTTFVVLLDTVLLLPHLFFQPSSFSPPLLFIHPLCSSTEVFPSFFTSSSFSLPRSLQYHSLSLFNHVDNKWLSKKIKPLPSLSLFHDGEWTSIVKKRCYHACSWIKILWYEGYWWIWPQDAWCGLGKNHNSAKLWKNQKKCEIWFQLSRTQTTAGADNRLNGRHMDDPSQRILPKLIRAATSRKRKLKLKGKVAK